MNDRKLKELKQAYDMPHMSEEQVENMRKQIEKGKTENRRKRKYMEQGIAAAAVIAAFVILPNTSASVAHAMESIPILGKLVEVVTFRDYQYEDERNHADIKIPELIPQTIVQDEAASQETGDDMAEEKMNTGSKEVQESLKKTTEEINAEIREITSQIVTEFEENLQYEQGYQDVIVKSEVISTTAEFFTLKLICYQGAGSGAEWDYFYTIDLNTGERLQLKDLFKEGTDYITPISENIKVQMREQMAADDMKYYWLEDEIEEWNFKQITDETSFYLNETGNIVICFNEGDVAPMYMGCVEFVISEEAVADIRK